MSHNAEPSFTDDDVLAGARMLLDLWPDVADVDDLRFDVTCVLRGIAAARDGADLTDHAVRKALHGGIEMHGDMT